VQHKKILERTLPEALKLSIARKIENNLFSKVQLLIYPVNKKLTTETLFFVLADFISGRGTQRNKDVVCSRGVLILLNRMHTTSI
jgi:hypothetical protein